MIECYKGTVTARGCITHGESNHFMFNIIFYTLLSIGMLLYSAGAHSLTLIAHPDTPSTLNAQQVKRIFTGKQRQFDDGSSVIPINQPEGSAARTQFDSSVLGRSTSQITAYWSKRVFTGKGQPPIVVVSDSAMLSYVQSTPGAVGYLSDNVEPKKVRVITLTN